MTGRLALGALVAGSLAVAAAYASAFLPGGAPPWGAWAMVVGITLLCAGFMVIGAVRPGRGLGVLRWPIGFASLVILAGFAAVLLLPAEEGAGAVLWGGLPRRAALLLYGIGLLPGLVLPLAYALTFERMTLGEGDLERIREAARRARGEAPR